MFTGLIRDIGKVISFHNETLKITSNLTPAVGDSIAVNGACLTVTETGEKSFSVELGDESRSVLALENYKNRVHLEPAMRLSDRLDGHIMQGHVDSIGMIEKIDVSPNSHDFYIKVEKNALPFMVPKGSVGIDGVSLTVNSVDVTSGVMRLTIIPHTFKHTLLQEYAPKRRVNIESDLLVRTLLHQKNLETQKEKNWAVFDKIAALY